ncbi:MAG: hypothetical protein HY367_00685 [Candidatus Aenigmarchaeota archaeon]|nr:hypothetical protein [Candidatus Aenigmarchaeota archaeon]
MDEKAKMALIVVVSAFASAFAANMLQSTAAQPFPVNMLLIGLAALMFFFVVYIALFLADIDRE